MMHVNFCCHLHMFRLMLTEQGGFNCGNCMPQELFAEAAESAQPEGSAGAYLWYPFSYAAGFHLRRASWCLEGPGLVLLSESPLHFEGVHQTSLSAAVSACTPRS